jgi:hypothetical protein
MTLLVGTRSPAQVVISADGMSFLTQGAERHLSRIDLQKIFPVQATTIAVAHHGENVIGGVPVEMFLPSFLSGETPVSVLHLVDRIARDLDEPIRNTLAVIPDAKKCAFWVCGFSHGTKAPRIIEVEWKKTSESIDLQRVEGGDLFMSGNGHDFVAQFTRDPNDGQFSWQKLWSANEKYHLRFHEKIWRIAEARQESVGRQAFGGHRHTVVLTPRQWRWASPPRSPN